MCSGGVASELGGWYLLLSSMGVFFVFLLLMLWAGKVAMVLVVGLVVVVEVVGEMW